MEGGMTPKRLTKRQRKALKGPNAAVQHSIQHGDTYVIAGTRYMGKPKPHFTLENVPGIPFVRA